MAVTSWFPRAELKEKLGLSEPAVRTLEKIAQFIQAQADITAAQTAIADQGDAIDAANTDITAANAAINALDGRLDAYDALAPFVQQDQAPAPSYAAYAGQTVSAGYVQAEAQATDNAAKALGTALAALITALQTANVLT